MTRTPQQIRNVVLIGHADAGKTSLAEAILHRSGAIPRLGSVAAGTTVLDFEEDERAKQHSIGLAVGHAAYDGCEINLIDVPGYPDFFGDAYGGVVAGDIACIVVNARTGIGLNTRKAWRLATQHGLAKMIVVNKVDLDNVDLDALTAQLQDAFGQGCVWFRRPTAAGPGYRENADALADPAAKERITEAAVEIDEALLEKYLEEGEVSPEELSGAITSGIQQGKLVPMIGCAATELVGVDDVLHVITRYMPSPVQARARLDAEGQELDRDGPFVAQVFKVVMGDYGAQSYIRVLAGSTAGHGTLTNMETGATERVGDFQRPQGKQLEPLGALVTGDVAIVPKVDTFNAGDTITDGRATVKMPRIEAPRPMVSLAISPKTRADETKMRPALDRIEREDLTFETERHEETKELVIKGMSQLHLETLLDRMKERTKVEVERRLPRVAYRETIRGKAEARYRHKKQSGGAGEFGEVALRLAPAARGEGFVFKNVVVGGAISASFIPAIEKGIVEAMEEGVVAGYRFVDCVVEVFDGKEHPVDSKEVAFKKAGRGAFKEAVAAAKPALLEPILEVTITVPDRFTGDVMGDLARRRSHPQGMDQSDEGTVIRALVPEAEMQTYSQDLRSMTSGEGVFDVKFHGYELLPPDKAQPLIDAHEKERHAEH